MKLQNLPRWIVAVAALVACVQALVVGLMLLGKFHGAERNVVPQALIGGGLVYLLLAAWLLRFNEEALPRPPARAAIALLVLFALVCVGWFYWETRQLLRLPYDLACWSEPMFVSDIVKWRTGAPLYLPPGDSNSGPYTFGAPALTYLLARVAGRGDSIVAYRWIQHLYLWLAALFVALGARQALRLYAPERAAHLPRVWLPFFLLSGFLFTVNQQTGAFNIFLHNDPLGLTLGALAFYLLLRHAESQSPRVLWLLALMPAAGFLAKQVMAIFAPATVVYLWLDGRATLRRVLAFAAVSFGALAVVLGLCFAVWGSDFRYWVFTIMGQHVVSLDKLLGRFSDAALFLLPGIFAGLYFLRGEKFDRMLGVWMAWLVAVCAGIYTSGITFSPSHLGPASLMGFCLCLAALAALWPEPRQVYASPRTQWVQVAAGTAAVVTLFAAFGFLRPERYRVTSDLERYVADIEREFQDVPPERVLLDNGEWIYARYGIVARDRMPVLVTHRGRQWEPFVERLRSRHYSRLLIRLLPSGRYSYDLGRDRDLKEVIDENYRLVRRIPRVEGMEDWRYRDIAFTEVLVFEPK